MDQEKVKITADKFIDELHRLEEGDDSSAERLAQLFAPDAELTNSILQRDGGGRQGQDAIADFWHEYASTFGEVKSDFFEVVTSDHSAGLFWRSSGTGPSGQPLEYEGVSLLVLNEDGKIARFQGFFDTRQLTFKGSAH